MPSAGPGQLIGWAAWAPPIASRLPWLQRLGLGEPRLRELLTSAQHYRWLLAGGLVAAGLIVAVALVMLAAGDKEPPVAEVEPAPVEVPVAPPPPPPVVPIQTTLHPDLVTARSCLESGDYECARQALTVLTEGDIYLTQTELDELATLEEEVAIGGDALSDPAVDVESLGATVVSALAKGPVDDLKNAIDGISKLRRENKEIMESFDAATRAAILEGDKIIVVYRRMWGHKNSGSHLEVVRVAGQLIDMYPPYAATATEHRQTAAQAIEEEAAAMAANNDPLGAASRLRLLKTELPERQGLDNRIRKMEALYQADRAAETALAEAQNALAKNQPAVGMSILAALSLDADSPYLAQVDDLKRQLKERFQQLDQQAPVVRLANPDALLYTPNEPVRVTLQVTDDYAVESVAAYARFGDTGSFSPVTVTPDGGGAYTFELDAAALDNPKWIHFYVEARDRSNHVGTLGSAQAPQEIKKRGFLKRTFGP